jgi:hypothetical protein
MKSFIIIIIPYRVIFFEFFGFSNSVLGNFFGFFGIFHSVLVLRVWSVIFFVFHGFGNRGDDRLRKFLL